MKRVLALILTMVVGLGLLTACAPDQDTCDHNWSEWTVVTEATCTVDGSEKRTCSICKGRDPSYYCGASMGRMEDCRAGNA